MNKDERGNLNIPALCEGLGLEHDRDLTKGPVYACPRCDFEVHDFSESSEVYLRGSRVVLKEGLVKHSGAQMTYYAPTQRSLLVALFMHAEECK